MAPFHAHASAPMVATAATSVTKLRTTPDVNVPERLPKSRVLLLCWSQSSLVKTVRRYRRDASEYGTSPLVSMFRGSAHVAGNASARRGRWVEKGCEALGLARR